MALPACFHLAADVFPRVRGEAARRLAVRGLSQSRIADAVGVSQAMVSKYQHAPSETDDQIVRLAEELLAELDRPPGGLSAWCETLSGPRRTGLDAATADVLVAERLLRENPPLRLVPQIGLNLARALPDSTSERDVLSYPGRLIAADDSLLAPAPPRLGASGHLARCLLAHRRGDPDIGALASIAAPHGAVQAAGHVATLPPDGDREAHYHAAAAPGVHVIHDPGAFGIEPCLYIAGPDATTVAKTILRLHEALP